MMCFDPLPWMGRCFTPVPFPSIDPLPGLQDPIPGLPIRPIPPFPVPFVHPSWCWLEGLLARLFP